MAIVIGISAKGQNVATWWRWHLRSPRRPTPCVLLTLFWTALQHGRHHGRHGDSAPIAAIGLVMVSPNLTYPKTIKAAAQKVIDGAPARMTPITEALASGDAARCGQGGDRQESAGCGRGQGQGGPREVSRARRPASWVWRSRCSSFATPA